MARKKAVTWSFPQAVVVEVHDADTVILDVIHEFDIGFNDTSTIKRRRSFRLYLGGKFGLNARELIQEGGPEAQVHLAARLPVGTVLRLESVKNDKFGGRFDAILFDGEVNVCEELVTQQWAAPWDGTGERPIPPWPRTIA